MLGTRWLGGEQGKAGSPHWLGADKDGRLWGCLSERKRCTDCPVVHRCKKHAPKPTQNIDSAASVSEYTQSQSELALLSGQISCVYPSYLRLKLITQHHPFVRKLSNHGLCPIIRRERGDAAIHPPGCIYLLSVTFWFLIPDLNLSGSKPSGSQQQQPSETLCVDSQLRSQNI